MTICRRLCPLKMVIFQFAMFVYQEGKPINPFGGYPGMVSHLRPPLDGWKLQGPHRPPGFAELLSSAQWAAELLAALPGRAGNPRINRSTWKMLRSKTECSCSFWVSVFLKVMIQVSLYIYTKMYISIYIYTCICIYVYIHTL